jgi:ribokinase
LTGVARVAVLGSINMDLVVRVRALPRAGDTVLGERLLTIPGGKGANQAAAAARLGARVRMVGRVGADAFGHELLGGLAADGIDVTGVDRDSDEPSGAALILVEEGGQNVIAVAPGANGRVAEAEVSRLAQGLAAGDVVVLQAEIPVAAVQSAAVMARRAGAVVVFNAAPRGSLTLDDVPEVDVLVVNEGEAAELSGTAVVDVRSAEEAARKLHDRARSVAVTLGGAGSVLHDAGRSNRIEGRLVNAVDVTAAGDAFVGGLAAGLASGWTLLEAVRFGGDAGAAAATKLGARSSLPTKAELEALFEASKR